MPSPTLSVAHRRLRVALASFALGSFSAACGSSHSPSGFTSGADAATSAGDDAAAEDGAAAACGSSACGEGAGDGASSSAAADASDGAASDHSDAGNIDASEDAGSAADAGAVDAGSSGSDSGTDSGLDAAYDAAVDAPSADVDAACVNLCTSGATMCSGADVQYCQVGANGCTAWTAPQSCGAYQTCVNDADAGPACECAPSTCTATGTFCDGSGAVTTCAIAHGCYYASATTTCTSPAVCIGAAPNVVCGDTIYANTDDTLYALDPVTEAVTSIGAFSGAITVDGSSTITDLAINSTGALFACSEATLYTVALPAAGTGAVALTKLATIATASDQHFYALGFTPAGALGTGSAETLIGGDGNGELWAIDSSTGATKDLGSFGKDPSVPGNILALSGDVVFYSNPTTGAPTGLATIRSCAGTTCSKTNDLLAGIDMTALAKAYTSGIPATTLNGGIYGGSSTSTGPGIGHGEVFGLGAWQGSVFGFARAQTSIPAAVLTVNTTSGAGTLLAGAFSFTNGWSGAAVTSSVTVTVPPPPPPPSN
jgi:hypothetical protein